MSAPPATTATDPVVERAEMRRRVDAACQAGDDDDAFLAELGREIARETPAVGRGVAGADHRDHRRQQHFGAAEHGQYRRRVLDRARAGG